MSTSKARKTGPANSRNYWTPLQALPDNDDSDSEITIDSEKTNKKVLISPIKVLAKNCEFIHGILAKKAINRYCVKKMSIGTKIICEDMETFNFIKVVLAENKCQFYTHDQKEDRVFKVVLLGLDNNSSESVKIELLSLGLKCKEVKLVTKNMGTFTDYFYIVSFENGSVRLNDLRKNVKSMFRTIIKWEFQRRLKSKLVQCRNCQMYGHGERGCNITTKCMNCAGIHKTSDCQTPDKIRCANCNGKHKSSDATCPNRSAFVQIKEKIRKPPQQQHAPKRSFVLNSNQFPSLSTRETIVNPHSSAVNANSARAWSGTRTEQQHSIVENNDSNTFNTQSTSTQHRTSLFSEDVFAKLTMEMITRLSECNSKEQQFNVIAQLAIKYLYSQ